MNKVKRFIIEKLSDSRKLKIAQKTSDKEESANIIQLINDDGIKKETLKKLRYPYKIAVIKTIQNPEIRLDIAMKELSENEQVEILTTIDDLTKIKVLDKYEGQEKVEIAKSIKDSGKKVEALDKFEGQDKVEVAKSIEDSGKKVEALDKFEGQDKVEVAKSIEDSRKKVEALDKFEGQDKVEVAKSIKDYEKILEVLDKFEGQDKVQVVQSIPNQEKRLEVLDKFEGQQWIDIVDTLVGEDYVLKAFSKANKEQKLYLVRKLQQPEKVLQAIEELDLDNKECLKRMYQKNQEVIKNIDFRFLDSYYVETLGEEKINLISCYPEIQKAVLELEEHEYEIFIRCLNSYIERTDTDEWTIMAHKLLTQIKSGQYSTLIESIEDFDQVDIEKLSKIIQLPNLLGIKTTADIEKYEELMEQYTDRLIMSKDIEERRFAVVNKLFGQGLGHAKRIVGSYGRNIHCISDGEETDYVKALEIIMKETDGEVLKQIYDECEGIGLIDEVEIERRIIDVYGKKFNEGLYKPNSNDLMKEEELPENLKGLGVKVYNAGTDFKMIMTSVSGCGLDLPEDYKRDWNKPLLKNQHFCTSYIRNDMLGTVRKRLVCYGFSQMKENSLLVYSSGDIGSNGYGFEYSQKHESKLPDELINETITYNEMAYKRFQNGERKQPDYIIVFIKDGIIYDQAGIKSAIRDWGENIPVVLIDESACLEAEKRKLLGDSSQKRRFRYF